MVRPDRASLAHTAPLDDLLSVTLRQFKRPLAELNIEISTAEIQTIARDAANNAPLSSKAAAVRAGLIALIEDSRAVLAGWNLTFQQAMATGMDAMPGWETTAEFLELASEKGNAELRIASGAVLVTALGDLRYRDDVLYLATHDDGEFESILAQRLLLQRSGADAAAPDWTTQVRTWLAAQS